MASEHVWPDPAGGDFVEAGHRAGGVDVSDEGVDHLMAASDVRVRSLQRGEDPVRLGRQLLGNRDRFGDRFGDPPVFGWQVRVMLVFGRGDGRRSVVLDE
jgi:hypothetical protein